MLKIDQFRKKLKIELDGVPFQMIEVDFVRPGKGQGFVRTKLRNLLSGAIIERTFKSNETANPALVEEMEMQYLYTDGTEYTFMNNETFEQVGLTEAQLGSTKNYLYEGLIADISFYKGNAIGCELANFLAFEIVECEPGAKGNTATNATKPAVLSSGYRLNVPLFVEQDSWIRVDTRTGQYEERCKRPEGR